MRGGFGGMRAILLLAFAGVVAAEDLPVWVVRVTTERASFGAPSRQTLLAPALPVEEGGLLVVGFALEPSDDKDEALRVTAIDPKGATVPAEIIGGDEELNCTLFRLTGSRPDPVPLEAAPCAVGDEVVLLSRHGEVMRYAPRRGAARVDAAVTSPRPLASWTTGRRSPRARASCSGSARRRRSSSRRTRSRRCRKTSRGRTARAAGSA
jgi:hypothetical protein